jgi:hypothetical protein
MSDGKIACHVCERRTKPTVEGRYRLHNDQNKEECPASRTLIPAPEGLCQNESPPSAISPSAQSAESSPGGATGTVSSATDSMPSSPNSPALEGDVSTASAQPALLGANEYAQNLAAAAPVRFSQPSSGRKPAADVIPMTELGKEICATFDAIFYAYQNRKTDDNRSAQVAMGPSAAGSPCTRRVAMSLMKVPAVNPGGDGWRAFIGTQIHRGLEEVFSWANADTGRFATEMKLTFPSEFVPKGTGDLLDRTMFVFEDFKAMSEWSLNKLKTKGPSTTYLRQVMLYAYAARLRGEQVDHVCIFGLPADGKSLEEKYAWTAPYDPKIALDALARVEQIAEEVERQRADGVADIAIAADAPIDTSDGCTYCPFYMQHSKGLAVSGGCNGKV